MKHLFLTLFAAALSMTVGANDYDQNKPFGFCTVSSRTDASSTFNITGGGCYAYPVPKGFTGKVTVLKSNGEDMKGAIQNAIKQNDVIILDGSDGDFIVSSNIGFENGNKTILGINNARLCTKWFMTDEIKTLLDNAVDERTPGKVGVKNMSTNADDNLGGTVNGNTIKEQAEYITRKILFEKYGNEDYRKSGIFTIDKKQNIIIRNIKFVGPGSVDVGGYDLISFTGTKNCWIDHCEFTDGMDGNFDITNSSDFNTVTWCTFSYTERSYVHQNTNLIGSSDSEATGYLNTTFAFNWWSTGCNQRMPMARVGKIHMLNNYYTCANNSSAINPRKNSEFLVEGNYFDTGVKKVYSQSSATAVTWKDDNYIAESSVSKPSSFGTTVTVPYEYTVASYSDVPAVVKENAGATLQFKDDSSEGDVVEKALYSTDFSDWTKASAAQNESTVTQQTKYSHETLTFTLFNTAIMSTEDSKFSSYTTLPHMALQAAKNSDPYVTTSKLASITKVRFVHAATGSNRGWKLEAKGDGDTDWVTISNSVANPAGWCEVTANVNRTNVELRFTNLTSNQNAYMFELDIYGNVNMGGTPSLGKIKANGQTYDLSDVFEENANGDMEATVEISKTATMISESNPIEAVADNGTIGTITYAATATSCKVTIPVTANDKTLNYIINFIQKPDFTLTYIGPDGQNIGTQKVEKDAAIGTFEKNIADVAATKDGYKARGWFKQNRVGEKFTTESIITENTNLYAVETEIEVASDSKKYTFNLTDKNFDAADHEAFNSVGSGKYHNNHGWAFGNGDKIELLVGKKASISLGLCQYSADGATISASNGSSVNAKVSTDGSYASFNYEGDAGTLTLTINSTGTVYIHQVIIHNTYTTNYDVVESWYIVKKGDADSFTEVLDIANNTGGSNPIYIFLPDGTYDLGEKVKTPISRNNISIIGQSADKTVIMTTPPLEIEGLDKADLLKNTSTNLYMQDISLKNAMYYDGKTTGRAATLHDQGTQTINKNVRHLSHQDTYYSHKTGGLFYFEGGELHGTVDYLCGNGKVYFNEVTLVNEERSSATITANSELYVFNNCTIKNNADTYNFGRAWSDHPTCVFLNTTLEDPDKLVSTRWNLDGINCDYKIAGEYGTKDKDGNNITPASNTITFKKENTTLNTILDESALNTYAIDKVLGSWATTAQQAAKQLPAPSAIYDNGTVTWSAIDGASAYALFKNGDFLGITTSTSYNVTVDATKDALTIRTANGRGGFGTAAAIAGTVNGISTIQRDCTTDGAIYNLQGQRINAPAKGLYIRNGKKVVMK